MEKHFCFIDECLSSWEDWMHQEDGDNVTLCRLKLEELKSQYHKLKEAANQLHHLHLCEQEGIGSGQPTTLEWLKAVDELGEILHNSKK